MMSFHRKKLAGLILRAWGLSAWSCRFSLSSVQVLLPPPSTPRPNQTHVCVSFAETQLSNDVICAVDLQEGSRN